MATRDLLIEIGVEELPASFIEPALAALAESLVKELDAGHRPSGGARTSHHH